MKTKRDHSSDVMDDIIWGLQHDAFDSRVSQSALRAWSLGVRDPIITRLLHEQVHPLRVREAFGTLTPFRKPRLHRGEIVLGADTDGQEIRLPKHSTRVS